MEINKKSVNVRKSFSDFLNDCIPKEKPKSLNDSKFVAIIIVTMNTAHQLKCNISDVGFFTMVEKNLESVKIEMSVEEYMYISNIMDKLITPLAQENMSIPLKNNAHSHIQ